MNKKVNNPFTFFKSNSGQSVVELAMMLPLIILVSFAMINIGLLLKAQIIVTYAAREGARTGAVTNDDQSIRGRIETVMGDIDDNGKTTVEIIPHEFFRGRGSDLKVRITYRYSIPFQASLPEPFDSEILRTGEIPVASIAVTRVEID